MLHAFTIRPPGSTNGVHCRPDEQCPCLELAVATCRWQSQTRSSHPRPREYCATGVFIAPRRSIAAERARTSEGRPFTARLPHAAA
jgi:hypothetical protein